jgi:sugar lactone lactonase YvrE
MTDRLLADIELLWDTRCVLGEGLVHDRQGNALWFVDIKQPRLFRFGLADGRQRTWTLPAQVSAIALAPAGWTAPRAAEVALLSVGASGFAWLLADGGSVELAPIAHPELHIPTNRFNDGKVGPDGRFYAGTMDDAEAAATGAFYALDRDGRITRIDGGYRVTNGPAFAPAGDTIYENDSALRRTYAFDLGADGTVGGKRLLHQFSEAGGYPDGMVTDAAGDLWIAMWDGSRLQRLAPRGVETGYVEVPVRRPTSCVVLDGGDMAFTSASIGLADTGAAEGGLFRARRRW